MPTVNPLFAAHQHQATAPHRAQNIVEPQRAQKATAPHRAQKAIDQIEVRAEKPEKDGKFSFGDFFDTINPLQHIPVLNVVYRQLTGDTIDTGPRLAGAALFGGAIGFAASVVNAAFDQVTGKDIGEHVWDFAFGQGDPDQAPTKLAAVVDEKPETQTSPPAPQIHNSPWPTNGFAQTSPQPTSSLSSTQSTLSTALSPNVLDLLALELGQTPLTKGMVTIEPTAAKKDQQKPAPSHRSSPQMPSDFLERLNSSINQYQTMQAQKDRLVNGQY